MKLHKCDCLCKNQPCSCSHAQKFKFIFGPAYGYSHPDSSGPVFCGEDLQPCKIMTDTLAPMERTNWVLSAWNSTLDRNDVPSA